MAGEKITSDTLPEAKEELRNIYKSQNSDFREITKEEYEALDYDERPDSDNHLNEESAAPVIDLAFYKYIPNREIAYRIVLKHKDGDVMEDYFVVTPEPS